MAPSSPLPVNQCSAVAGKEIETNFTTLEYLPGLVFRP